IGHYQFTPKIIPTLVTLVLLPVLISLGIWQLHRADEKREILAKQEARHDMPPIDIDDKNETRDKLEFRRLQVVGKFLKEYLILVDNKVHQGQAGYYVVTPLRIKGTDTAVLVNRGWVKATNSREVLPDVSTPSDDLTIRGTAKYDTKDIFTFGDENRLGKDWPALVRWIDIKALARDIPYKLKPFLILQEPGATQEFVREWTFVNSSPDRNMSYAAQWFTLAAALLIIFFVVNTKRINRY
ncbi:MAG: SURF1 family protein, partial [Thioalkalispiraceae bacterium]